MGAIWRFLEGKKTYVTAVALGIAGVLLGLNIITQEQYNNFVMVALPAGLAFLRSAVNRPPQD